MIACIYQTFFIHKSVEKPLACFHILSIVDNAAMNIRVYFILLDIHIHRTEMSGSYYSSSLNFFINTIFHSDCTIYIPTNCAQRVSFSPHICQRLLFLFQIAILRGVMWCLIVVFIYISLKISDVKNLFMDLLAIYMSSL